MNAYCPGGCGANLVANEPCLCDEWEEELEVMEQ